MTEARKRTSPAASSKSQANGVVDSTSSPKKVASNGITVIDVLRVLGGIVLLNCALSYFVTNQSVTWGWRPWFSKPGEVRAWLNGPINLSDLELMQYDGRDPETPIYLALNGSIYDVTAGRRMYGPGGSYHFFAGRDASRAFVTGCFDTDITPDMRGAELTYVPVDPEDVPVKELSKAELKVRREREYRLARKMVQDTIEGWAKMFRGEGGKPYFKVGEVKRGEGWIDMLPKRELCERAQKQRPKRKVG